MRTVNAPIIESDADLAQALARIDKVFDAPSGTPEADEAEALTIMIESYERRTILDRQVDPVEAIRFAMDQRGYAYTDLAKVIGSSARASDVMNRRRRLSLAMIRRLHQTFRIPLESLIAETPLVHSPKQKQGRKPLLAVSESVNQGFGH